MLKAAFGKNAKALALILLLSVFLSATTAFAATKYIEADEGGAIRVAHGIWLLIPPGSLEEDTLIFANMRRTNNCIYLKFEPSGTAFAPDKPGQLCVSWLYLRHLDGVTLYSRDGAEVTPEFKWWGMEYDIDHFSLYYFRRR